MSQYANVIDGTVDNFNDEVLERSARELVVVDFTATWCQPCKTLGPVLEKVTGEHVGEMTLVKIDVDQVPELAQEFGVSSIPAVFAIKNKTIVDQFAGAPPESALRAWVARHLPTAAAKRSMAAIKLEATDPNGALSAHRQAITLAPEDPAIVAPALRFLLAQGQIGEVRDDLERLEGRGFLEPELEVVKAALSLREHAPDSTALGGLRERFKAAPGDLGLQLELGEALAAQGYHSEALPMLLDLVDRDFKGTGVAARQAMVNVFQSLPVESPVANDYRRKLYSLLN